MLKNFQNRFVIIIFLNIAAGNFYELRILDILILEILFYSTIFNQINELRKY